MPWIQLKITTTGQQADTLSDALTESGAVSVTFQDTHDVPVYEPLPGETRLWGDTDVIGLLLMLGMHLAGALGRAVMPGLDVPDLVVPTLMVQLLPPLLAGIFLAAPLAAIMSTINAQLLQSSATIIKDLYLSLQPHQASNERRLKRISSLVTLVLGLLLLLAAWRPPEMIIWLNLLAFGGMEAVFLWPLVLGLYWERANAAGALSSMITGGASYAALAGFHLQPGGFHPIVLALALSLLAFLAGNRFGRPAATAF